MLTNRTISLGAVVAVLAALLQGLEVRADTGFSSVSSSSQSATFSAVSSDEDPAIYDFDAQDTGTGSGSAGSTSSRNTSWAQAMATAAVTPGPGSQQVLSASGLTELSVTREAGFPLPGVSQGLLGYEMSSTIVSDTLSIGDPVDFSGEIELSWLTTSDVDHFTVTADVSVEVWRGNSVVGSGFVSLGGWVLSSSDNGMGSPVDPTGSTACVFSLSNVQVGDVVKLKYETFGDLTESDTHVGTVGFNVQAWVTEP